MDNNSRMTNEVILNKGMVERAILNRNINIYHKIEVIVEFENHLEAYKNDIDHNRQSLRACFCRLIRKLHFKNVKVEQVFTNLIDDLGMDEQFIQDFLNLVENYKQRLLDLTHEP